MSRSTNPEGGDIHRGDYVTRWDHRREDGRYTGPMRPPGGSVLAFRPKWSASLAAWPKFARGWRVREARRGLMPSSAPVSTVDCMAGGQTRTSSRIKDARRAAD